MKQACTDARRRRPRHRWGAAVGFVVALVALVSATAATAATGGKVLVYYGNDGASQAKFTNFAAAAGRDLVTTAVTSSDVLPGNLSQNACILLPVNGLAFDASQQTALRDYVVGGGTIVAMGENGGVTQGPLGNLAMNGLGVGVGATGIGAGISDQIDSGVHVINGPTRIAASPYTAGVTSLKYAFTTRMYVSPPASILLSTDTNNIPFVAVQEIGAGKWVQSGDSNVFSDDAAVNAFTNSDNGRFARNLCGDIGNPAVTLVTPPQGARYTKNQVVNADWFCTDSDSGIDPDLAKTFGTVPDGDPIDTAVTSGGSVTKTFRATCTDNAGNSVFEEHQYVVDDRPPTITITVPGIGPYALGASVPASWSCTDPDNDVATVGYTNGALSGTQSGAPIITSPEGPKSFTVTCTDLLGNSASETIPYTVANSPPVPSITSPLNGARFKAGTAVNAVWGCSDPDGPGDLVAQTSAPNLLSGSPIDTTTGGPGSFSVVCEDEDGPVTKTHTYFVDASPPVPAIAVPLAGGVYERRSVVPASWACTDDDGPEDIDPNPLKTFGTVPVGSPIDTGTVGVKSFSVTCTDRVGNTSLPKTVQYTVVDASPPVVTITNPKDGATYNQGQVVAPSYACTDADGIGDIKFCVRADGATGPVNTSKPGTFEFTVNGEDLAGNKGTATVRYTVKAAPGAVAPTQAAGAPVKKACASRRQFRIRVKKLKGGARAVSATVFVNGKKTVTRKGKRLTATVTLKGLKKGRYTVKINVKYSNGRVLTYTRRFKTCTPKGK